MRKILYILFFIGCVVMIITFANKGEKRIDAQLGGVTLSLEIADTAFLRTRGLSGHQPLASNEGMLFVFPEDDLYEIWMKDMLFSIDIIWLDSEYRIVDVKERASPESYPEVFTPSVPARYVLELSLGFFKLHGLKKGDRLEFVN